MGHVGMLAESGLTQAVVFITRPTGSLAVLDALRQHGVRVRHLPLGRNRVGFSIRFARLCRRERVDTVFTHGLGFHLVVAVAARLAGARRVVVLVGNPIARDDALRRQAKRRTRIADVFVERVVACSQHVADDIYDATGLPDGRVIVVPNPLDVPVIRARADAARSSRRPGGPSVVCTVARLDPIKDHDTVLRAVAHLRGAGRDVVLRLVGSGPLKVELVRLADRLGITEAVEFLGDRADIPELLGASDIFAYGMTREEGYGIVLSEAMAAGIPVVCTDDGPANEVLVNGRGGRLVPPGDAEAMADAIGELLDHPSEAEQLIADAYEVCLHRHDRTQLAGRVRELAGIP